MELFGKTIDKESQLLIGIGAAVAAGCEPCLTHMVGMANQAGVKGNKLRTAAIIGQFVKDQPAQNMKKLADELLGTHLNENASSSSCPMEKSALASEAQSQEARSGPSDDRGCGCS